MSQNDGTGSKGALVTLGRKTKRLKKGDQKLRFFFLLCLS
jgi:hypothetical protein